MMYPYMTLSDGTEIVHSQLLAENGKKTVYVHFERPKEGGFDDARIKLPEYQWVQRDGFSDDEIRLFTKLVKSNAHLLYKYAENGGIKIA